MCKCSSLIFWKFLYNRRGSSNQLNLSGQVVCEYLRSTGFWNCFFHKGLLWYMILFTGNLPVKIKILSLLPKNCWKQKLDFSRSAPFHMKTSILSIIVSGNTILFLTCSKPVQTFIFITILVTLRLLTQFSKSNTQNSLCFRRCSCFCFLKNFFFMFETKIYGVPLL